MENNQSFDEDQKFFFDLHCHPTTKSFLTDGKYNPWEVINPLPIIGSQSCLRQLYDSKVCIGVYTIAALELAYSSNRFVNSILTKLPYLSEKLIQAINTGRLSYHQLFNNEIELLSKFLKDPDSERKVQLLEYFPPTDQAIENMKDGFYGIMAIEGSHALYNRIDVPCAILDNLSKIKNQGNFSYLYLTLTHLAWNSAANHAYNNKFIKDRVFKPFQKGISKHGFQIIDACYSNAEETYLNNYNLSDEDVQTYCSGKRILIDVKHMSAYSRKQFYKHRKDHDQEHIPILATHVGLTGFPLSHLSDYFDYDELYKPVEDPNLLLVKYKDVNGIAGTQFFPWSINLYDEEIHEIVKSSGLIGLNMDRRALGVIKKGHEFWWKEELNELVVDKLHPIGIAKLKEECLEEEFIQDYSEEEKSEDKNKIKHIYYLSNNLLHIFKVGAKPVPKERVKEVGMRYWKYVCLGSDFDGLINPIRNCRSVLDYHELQKDLYECLPKLMELDSYEYPKFTNKELTDIIRGFMYNNAIEFLKKYFTEEFLTTK